MPCLPLRLSLLVICAWAVYTISTGFIYPSVRSARTFPEKIQRLHSQRQVNWNLSLEDSEDDLNRPFEKHQPVPKSDVIRTKFQREPPDINMKNNYYGKLTLASRSDSLPRDNVGERETTENIDNQKRNLIYGQRKKKYRKNSYHGKTNVISGENSALNKLPKNIFVHEVDYPTSVSLGRRQQARKKSEMKDNPQESAIDWYKSEISLPNIGRIKNYGLSTFSSKTFLAPYYEKMPTYVGYHQHSFQKTTQPSHIPSGPSKVRLVLLWTPLYKGWNFLPQGRSAFSHCSESHCEVTSDRNRLKESHAVIFHIRTMSLLDLPPFRLPHQKWIFFSLEPPPQSYFPGFHFMYRMFNWTMTYRKDSDIVIPYGRVIPGSKNNKKGKDWELLWKNKTRPVVWMVSHCNTYSKREHFVRQLQNFIDVDILGGCGSAVCLFNQTYKCLEAFSRRYKFFLAFENSICDDYVTEKFFRALRYDIVPVVLGGADYKVVGPSGSYINAADFRSPKQLAEYLHKVSENSTLYRTYFKWKEDGYTVEDKPNHCSLCEKIYSLDFKAKSTYTNITKWWIEKSHCTKWTPK